MIMQNKRGQMLPRQGEMGEYTVSKKCLQLLWPSKKCVPLLKPSLLFEKIETIFKCSPPINIMSMETTNQGKNKICWASKLDQLLSGQSNIITN